MRRHSVDFDVCLLICPQHVKSVCNLLFHPMQSVRRPAALCAIRLALAPERIKAAFYREVHISVNHVSKGCARVCTSSRGDLWTFVQTNVVERELDCSDDICQQALQTVSGEPLLSLPLVFKDKLLASIPAKFYVPGCAHSHRTIGHKELVARALDKMEQIEHVGAFQVPEKAYNDACEQLLALHPDRVVQGALKILNASQSHADFVANLSTVVNVCGADCRLAEAFFHHCWSGSIERILTTTPTSDSDDSVLEALLSALCSMLDALQLGRVAPGKTLRFLVHVVKVYLLPILDLDGESLAQGFLPRLNLRRTILVLIHRLLEHDQSAGAHLVTPAIQASEATLTLLSQYVVADFEARWMPQAIKGVMGHSALESMLLLTRDSRWMAHYGRGGHAGHVSGADELFERVVKPLTKLLLDRYAQSTTGGLVIGCQPSHSFVDKSLVRGSLAVLVQMHANEELARMWRRTYFEFSNTAWLHAVLSDRETKVRALGFSLLASVAISLVDPLVAQVEFDLIRDEGNAATIKLDVLRKDSEQGVGGGEQEGAGAEVLILAPQYLEFLNVCAESALDDKEADLVCQQAMHYVVCSTRPAPRSLKTAVDTSDAWSTCTTSLSVREPENVLPNSSSNRDAAERGSESIFVDAAAQVAQEARTASVLQILNHNKFLDTVVDMLPPLPPSDPSMPAGREAGSDGKGRWRVLSGALHVLHNLSRTHGTSAVMDNLLSSPTVAQRLIQTMDVAGLWRMATSPLVKTEDEKMFPRMQGTLLHRSQWLAGTLLHSHCAHTT
jgi:hypothetical protein